MCGEWVVSRCEEGGSSTVLSVVSPEVNIDTAQGFADIRAKIGAFVSLLFYIDIE